MNFNFKIGRWRFIADYGIWQFFFVPPPHKRLQKTRIRIEAHHGASVGEKTIEWHTFHTFRSFAKLILYEYLRYLYLKSFWLTFKNPFYWQQVGFTFSMMMATFTPSNAHLILAGGAIAVTQHKVKKQTVSGTTCPITVTSTGSGHILTISGYNRNSRTISSVSDNIGTGAWTHATSANGSDSSANNTADSYYNLGPGSGVTTVTVQFSGTAGTDARTCEAWEVSGFTTPVFDTGGATLNAVGSGATNTGPTLVRTGTNSFSWAGINSSGSTSAAPKVGTGWSAGGDLSGDFIGGFWSEIESATGNTTPIATDGGSGSNFTITAASITESSGGFTWQQLESGNQPYYEKNQIVSY